MEMQPVETQFKIGFDSNLLKVDLGKDAEIPGVKKWINLPASERFPGNTMERAILLKRRELKKGVCKLDLEMDRINQEFENESLDVNEIHVITGSRKEPTREDMEEAAKNSSSRQGLEFMDKLCKITLMMVRKNQNGQFRRLLENLKMVALSEVLKDPVSRKALKESSFHSEEIDILVAGKILNSFIENFYERIRT